MCVSLSLTLTKMSMFLYSWKWTNLFSCKFNEERYQPRETRVYNQYLKMCKIVCFWVFIINVESPDDVNMFFHQQSQQTSEVYIFNVKTNLHKIQFVDHATSYEWISSQKCKCLISDFPVFRILLWINLWTFSLSFIYKRKLTFMNLKGLRSGKTDYEYFKALTLICLGKLQLFELKGRFK